MTSCEMCGGPLRIPEGRSRPPKFCAQACRQKAYRQRTTIPAEMRNADRWMRYRLVPRGGRVTKVPAQLSGRQASSTDALTWSTYADAKASKVGAGLGFALGDGIGCIDLDDCIDAGGSLNEVASRIVASHKDGALFIEVSQSGRGVHIFTKMEQGKGTVRTVDGQRVETYPPDSGRFIAVTGIKLSVQ